MILRHQERRMITRERYSSLLLAGILSICGGGCPAQEWPTRPITMIVPFAAGGPTDIVGRMLAEGMGDALGQKVIVENTGGGTTGSLRVAQAAPDGYTLGIGTLGTHTLVQLLHTKPVYDSEADFTPVALVAQVPALLLVSPKMPVKNFKEFVSYVKDHASSLSHASAGTGSAGHIACDLMLSQIGTRVQHIPYRGSSALVPDLAAGRINFTCDMLTSGLAMVQAGNAKPIAIMSLKRSPLLPDVPTVSESGLPGFEAYTWNALFLPRKSPADVVAKLNVATVRALQMPNVRDRLEGLGAELASGDRTSPTYLANLVNSELAKWREPVRLTGAVIND